MPTSLVIASFIARDYGWVNYRCISIYLGESRRGMSFLRLNSVAEAVLTQGVLSGKAAANSC